MKLSELLHECDLLNGHYDDCKIDSIVTDSRQAGAGSLFVAIKGLHVDGHDFIAQAIESGCAAVVVEQELQFAASSIAVIKVCDSRIALGEIAAAFYGYPSHKLNMIGVTGTNGKTTCTYLLESIIEQSGGVPGVIGTINYRFQGVEKNAPFTTPEPVELNKILQEMLAAGVTHVLMEVSSHALAQKRLQGILFDVALFGNLTRDHLDFHGSMEDYFNAKKELFSCHLKVGAKSIVFVETAEDEGDWGHRLLEELKSSDQGDTLSCSMDVGADFYCKSAVADISGSELVIQAPGRDLQIRTKLVGRFNVKNIIGAIALATVVGINDQAIVSGLAAVQNVPGRLERVPSKTAGFAVFVDYAHTPDAMQNVLSTLKQLQPRCLSVVFGCGGDRDIGKRALMGEVAGRLADLVFITADNSRSEDLQVIIEQIIGGVEDAGKKNINELTNKRGAGYMVVPSRHDAIAIAIKTAQKGDIVLISGKGHETYQISREGSIFFDDRIEAAEALGALGA